jgi:hypothetical protein
MPAQPAIGKSGATDVRVNDRRLDPSSPCESSACKAAAQQKDLIASRNEVFSFSPLP